MQIPFYGERPSRFFQSTKTYLKALTITIGGQLGGTRRHVF
jgi:hypothetical protein